MDWERLREHICSKITGKCLLGEPLKKHTTWKIGGPADILVIPQCKDDVVFTMKSASEYNLPVHLLGNGSNVLVLDKGIRGIVLKLAGGLTDVKVRGNFIRAEAGVLLPQLAQVALKAGLSGLEFMAGIPGTIGGAVVMNAGAYGGTIGDLVRYVEICSNEGVIKRLGREELNFSYRNTALKKSSAVVLEVELELQAGSQEQIEAQMHEYLANRKIKQPLNLPNAGSIFVNPPGMAAGYLLEKAGAKGLRVGGAQVSEKHANFIVNIADASAEDVLELITQIEEKVYKAFGIQLQREIKVLGEG